MRFDQVRREFKKTLWGEELDNEMQALTGSANLDYFYYKIDKNVCTKCMCELDDNEMIIYKHQKYCTGCIKEVIS